MPSTSSPYKVRVLGAIAEVPGAAWDALVTEQSTPFLRWGWLAALESSGCASAQAGWTPRHLTLWRRGELVAAAPAYVKEGSDGDFARDWDIASAAERGGLAFYPKLCVTVPFTPCTGQRLLVAPGEDRAPCVEGLARAAEAVARRERLASLQVLFPLEEEARALAAMGWSTRISHQYHWSNRGYRDLDEFLARLSSKRRSMLRREMAQPARDGISLRTVRGDELAQDTRRWAKLAHALHRHTVDQLMWGRRWLNEAFYVEMFAAMPDAVELVLAERGGAPIAGAFNVASKSRLYGRYWGCFEEHPFLHFNVCLYHSIRECIARGTQVFEGGAGGEHKMARGFEPVETFSSLQALDPRLDQALQRHLLAESEQRHAALERFRAESGIFKKEG